MREALQPERLEVLNESGNHNVPPGSETHFKVTAVAGAFAGQNAVARHREIYRLLAEEMSGGLHALALHLFTPEEWAKRPRAADSPPCEGGEKK